ncbi:MAG: biopolymer transporter ExbD [Lentimicrobiaceae bacterium]|jgi:biopolymer transport protein ExbD|nr:biopolymer transporter ExbD [Lentimicrobiaceae bacterium]
MAKRKAPEINSSSLADLAFLLLIFFLMTTTMDIDSGIFRRLPPPAENNTEDIKIKERNVMNVMVNKNDLLMVDGKPSNIRELKNLAKRFMTPNPNNEKSPEVETKYIESLGDVFISKGVISLKNDRGTSYDMYIQVQNELTRAFNELREEMAVNRFGQRIEVLSEDRIKAINDAIPVRISEAEPEEIIDRK